MPYSRAVNRFLVPFVHVAHIAVMTNDPRDVRLPIMVSRAEADAIDAWRYAHRIPTRAEAIRRLIQAGLAAPAERRTVSAEDEARAGPEAPPSGTPTQRRARRTA